MCFVYQTWKFVQTPLLSGRFAPDWLKGFNMETALTMTTMLLCTVKDLEVKQDELIHCLIEILFFFFKMSKNFSEMFLDRLVF